MRSLCDDLLDKMLSLIKDLRQPIELLRGIIQVSPGSITLAGVEFPRLCRRLKAACQTISKLQVQQGMRCHA